MKIPGIPEAAPSARHWTRAVCKAVGFDRAEAAELVVSEYVTNALIHSASKDPGGRILIRLETGPDGIRISVIDDGARPCEVRADHGRGLDVVEYLSDAYGAVPTGAGRRSWAYLKPNPPEAA
jgi:anti-sigma regulatory factor (Ser/Thr protein kinase)